MSLSAQNQYKSLTDFLESTDFPMRVIKNLSVQLDRAKNSRIEVPLKDKLELCLTMETEVYMGAYTAFLEWIRHCPIIKRRYDTSVYQSFFEDLELILNSSILQCFRDMLTKHIGYAVLSPSNIWRLAPYIVGKKVLSVGSGNAFVEYIIQSQLETVILCTDIKASPTRFLPIMIKNSRLAVCEHDADTLLSIWTPFIERKHCVGCNNCACNKRIQQRQQAFTKSLIERLKKVQKHKGLNKPIEQIVRQKVKDWRKKNVNLLTSLMKKNCSRCFDLEDCAYNALVEFRGDTFIYVGEGPDGCTGSDRLFDLLKREWNEIECIEHLNWNKIYSFIAIYQRK